MKFDFSGVITALVTPFLDGEVDFQSFRALLRSQLKNGVDGFVVNGTTGESPTLSRDEVQELLAVAKEEAEGKVPVILGTGTNATRQTVEFTLQAAEWGADAALVVVPYYNKPPQRGLMAHFREVADASRIPVIMYNVPGRTITGLELDAIEKLSQHPRIVGIKEASGDLQFDKRIIEATGDGFLLTSGDDATCVELARQGGRGVISVVSHLIPAKLKELFRRAYRQDEGAVAEFSRLQELVAAIYVESNPIPVKAALYLRGIIQSPELRLPLSTLPEEKMNELKRVLERFTEVVV